MNEQHAGIVCDNQSAQSDRQAGACPPRDELSYIDEILDRHAQGTVIFPWVPQELNESENLKILITDRTGGLV